MWWLFRSSPSAPWVLSLMRIVVGFMFLSVGTMKMFGFPSRGGAVIGVDPFTQIGIAAIIEVFGGTLVLLGLATRPVAFILSGEMAVAYFQVTRPRGSFRSSTAATLRPCSAGSSSISRLPAPAPGASTHSSRTPALDVALKLHLPPASSRDLTSRKQSLR